MLKVEPRSVPFSQQLRTKMLGISWLSNLGSGILGFLLARAVLMGELHPFGTSYLAAICVTQPRLSRATVIGVVFGTMLTVEGWTLASYLMSIGLIYAVLYRYHKIKGHWLILPGLVAAIHLLARGTGILFTENELYLWVGVLFEGFFAGVLTSVAVTGIQSAPQALEGKDLTTEERTSMGLIVLGGLIGLAQTEIFGLGIQSILARWLVLWGSLLGGPGGGAAVGVAVGLVPCIQGNLATGPVAFYALAGLFGGIFNSFKKMGVIVGFTLANLLLSLFFTEQIEIIQSLRETGVAIFAFIILAVPSLQNMTLKNELEDTLTKRGNRLIIGDRLKKMGLVLKELENVFYVEKEVEEEDNELSKLFNKVAAKVCDGCSLNRVCWEQDFYKTYRAMLEACSKLETRGSITEKEFGSDLKRRCMRLRELGVTLNSELEVLKLVNKYNKEFDGCRKLVKQQLKGLAGIVEDFSKEVENEVFSQQERGTFLLEKMQEKGIFLQGVSVIEQSDGEIEIIIQQKSCKDKNWCKAMVAPNISQLLDKTYVLKEQEHSCKPGGSTCTYHLVPSQAFQISVGKAQCAKDNLRVSGDVCSAVNLPDNRFALLMSDGMGAGVEALEESSTAVRLLEKLLLGGFSADMAVKTVNTAMFLRSGRESFVTLDVVIINQVNGQTDFIKIGGAPTLICTGRGVKLVNTAAPPAGILDNIDHQVFRQVLVPNNTVIMMSDGVWEAIHHADGPSGWLEDLLSQMKLSHPQQIASYLLYLAKKASGNEVRDDMCVQVARVEQLDIA